MGGTVLTLIVEHFESFGFMRVELEGEENVYQEYVLSNFATKEAVHI